MTDNPVAIGRALYQEIWQIVAANFFDTARLSEWGTWQNRFDEQIVDEGTAIAFARLALASLGDRYTCLNAPIPAAFSPAVRDGEVYAEDDSPARSVAAVLTPSNFAYIRVLDFDKEEIAAQMAEAAASVAECRGVILDLRYNSGGRVHRAIEAVGLFLENGVVTTVAQRKDGATCERRYCFNEEQFFCVESNAAGEKPAEFYHRLPAILASKPLVVLVGPRTASAAELFAAALVQNGSVGMLATVGGATAGKGIGQVVFPLSSESETTLSITSSRWYCPGGEWVGDCGQTVKDSLEPEVIVDGDHGPQGLKAASDALKAMVAALESTAA